MFPWLAGDLRRLRLPCPANAPQVASGAMTLSAIPAELRTAWQEDGWCVWQEAIPRADVIAASKALEHMFPSAEEMDSGTGRRAHHSIQDLGCGVAGVPVQEPVAQQARNASRAARPRRGPVR